MKRCKGYFIIPLALFVSLIVAGGVIYKVNGASTNLPATPIAITISNTGSSDESVMRDLLVRSYSVRVEALKSGDISQYPTVFSDDPATPLGIEHADFVKKVRDRYGKAAQPINGNGWLAYESAKVLDRYQNLGAFQRVQATAKAQGRILTADELKSVTQVDGNVPASAIQGGQAKVVLTNVVITANHALVTYETSATTSRATLVNTPDGWLIAGIETLQVHI